MASQDIRVSQKMTIQDQRVDPERYTIIPRTLCFIFHEESVLLIRYSKQKGSWAGKLNGIGGHIQPGETILQSAKREIREEIGLGINGLQLCGTVLIDIADNPGVGLYIFAVDLDREPGERLTASEEGMPVWVPLSDLPGSELMEDIPLLIEKSLKVLHFRQLPFSGVYRQKPSGGLEMYFDPYE